MTSGELDEVIRKEFPSIDEYYIIERSSALWGYQLAAADNEANAIGFAKWYDNENPSNTLGKTFEQLYQQYLTTKNITDEK